MEIQLTKLFVVKCHIAVIFEGSNFQTFQGYYVYLELLENFILEFL